MNIHSILDDLSFTEQTPSETIAREFVYDEGVRDVAAGATTLPMAAASRAMAGSLPLGGGGRNGRQLRDRSRNQQYSYECRSSSHSTQATQLGFCVGGIV